ncbi:YicC/YloC family endoribonuclease [Paenochrobactrum sp. BZR 588]|uniref:YicC/YloC family endoribonuclease n=1 Tax=unclassified Paenochrobactrum TaxID=2639760 RepID=UPI003853EB8A
MTLQSMTGFARYSGTHQNGGLVTNFTWEIRSVNGKGLDVRLRLPQGFEALEHNIRGLVAKSFTRGNMQVSLNIDNGAERHEVSINYTQVEKLLNASQELQARFGVAPLTLDGLFALRGVLDQPQEAASEEEEAALKVAVLDGLSALLLQLKETRELEGQALQRIFEKHVDEIALLTEKARHDPARTVEAIKTRLASQVSLLLDASQALDKDRLYAEAAYLATKADIQEELDRLDTHVASARKLLKDGGAIGRKLDFLSQEFNREANTLCAKSNAATITAIGLELKAAVDQFREQIQNLE